MQPPPSLARARREVNLFLRPFLDRPDCPLLYRMARYHLGWEDAKGEPAVFEGKGLRSTLCLLACEATGGNARQAVPAAAAVELVHNFSLIHDDIQDRDRERRHRPTVWAIWGQAQAINAGDALLALARLALLRLHDEGVPPEAVIDAAGVLDESTLRMVEGQVMDMAFEEAESIDQADYISMIERKTGALFDASLRLGGIAGGANAETVVTLGAVGRALGVAFQARDDMLGIWGAESRTGKEPAADIRRRKKSLPVVYALTGDEPGAAERVREAYRKRRLEAEDVSAVLEALDRTGAQALCARFVSERANEALELLRRLKSGDWARVRECVAFLLELND